MSADPLAERRTPMMGATYWFNRKRSGEMTTDEMRGFDIWLNRDPEHRAAYDELERYWNSIGAAMDDPSIITARERDDRRFNHARLRVAGLIAASVTLAAIGGWTLANTEFADLLDRIAPPPQELSTTIGQRSTIKLRDQSVVTLDTDTVVRLHESWRERRVELVRGQAYFKVAKDRHRPFLVMAGGRTVRATGTAFDVRLDPDRLRVTLIEGRVRVESPKNEGDRQSAEMRAGWRLEIAPDAHWRMSPVDINRETSWHDGHLSFFRDSLRDAASEMNRYSEKKIVLRGQIPERPVIGIFRAGDVEGFARAVELNRIARVALDEEDRIELVAW